MPCPKRTDDRKSSGPRHHQHKLYLEKQINTLVLIEDTYDPIVLYLSISRSLRVGVFVEGYLAGDHHEIGSKCVDK
jgi:hypothetical protein